jgi:hypothetical protein
MVIFALASRLDPNTRRLLQRMDEFQRMLHGFERRIDTVLNRLERDKESTDGIPQEAGHR